MSGIPLWAQLLLAVVAVALVFVLIRVIGHDKIEAILKKKRASSVLATSAEFVEGPTHIEVALYLDSNKLHYESPDIEPAFLDLKLVDEVEYDTDLATGGRKIEGEVLRVRAHGRTFEFVVSAADAKTWKERLPKHRANDPGEVHAVGATA